jgi:hypothetical protein
MGEMTGLARRLGLCAALAATAAVGGCGKKGDPLPPQIRIAETTRDLAAFQEGREAVLEWSYPSMTTAGGALPDLEAVEVWRATIPASQEPPDITSRDREIRYQLLESQGELLATLDGEALDAATRGARLVWRDDLEVWYRENTGPPPKVVWYAVRSICCRNRHSEFSNIARLQPQLPPAPPEELRAEPSAEGIRIRWQPVEGTAAMVERSGADGRWQTVTPDPAAEGEWLDRSAAQGSSYRYRLRSVRVLPDGERVIGEATRPLAVGYPDLYPPPPPANLVCLPEERRITVRWDASPGAAFYRVSRRQGESPPTVLAEAHRATDFEDTSPVLGEVSYLVRAVDSAGNLSEPVTCSAVMGPPP